MQLDDHAAKTGMQLKKRDWSMKHLVEQALAQLWLRSLTAQPHVQICLSDTELTSLAPAKLRRNRDPLKAQCGKSGSNAFLKACLSYSFEITYRGSVVAGEGFEPSTFGL